MIIKNNPDEIQSYNSDASNLQGTAQELIIPESIFELVDIVKEHNRKKQPITISGAGTGLSGGRVAFNGSVVSLEKFNQIEKIDVENRTISAGAAVPLREIQDLAKANGLLYPPNPTERESQIGGNIATNASGARTYKYGPTRSFVEALEIVLPDGELLEINRGDFLFNGFDCRFTTETGKEYQIKAGDIGMPDIKHAAGYYIKKDMDLIDLFIGSEGTLGVITRAKLKLIDDPGRIIGIIAFFENIDRALDYVEYLKECTTSNNKLISPRLIELFNNKALNLLRADYSFLPQNVEAAIWTEQEYQDNDLEILESWYKTIQKYSELADITWIAQDDNEHIKMREFRHSLPLKVNEIISKYGTIKFGTDVAVPGIFLKEFYYRIQELVEETGLDNVTFGHIGNNHIHANVFASNTEEIDIARKFYGKCTALALNYNGTVSAEHGIGKLKKQYLLNMFGEKGIETMKKIKLTLDPNKILGPGNLFD